MQDKVLRISGFVSTTVSSRLTASGLVPSVSAVFSAVAHLLQRDAASVPAAELAGAGWDTTERSSHVQCYFQCNTRRGGVGFTYCPLERRRGRAGGSPGESEIHPSGSGGRAETSRSSSCCRPAPGCTTFRKWTKKIDEIQFHFLKNFGVQRAGFKSFNGPQMVPGP